MSHPSRLQHVRDLTLATVRPFDIQRAISRDFVAAVPSPIGALATCLLEILETTHRLRIVAPTARAGEPPQFGTRPELRREQAGAGEDAPEVRSNAHRPIPLSRSSL